MRTATASMTTAGIVTPEGLTPPMMVRLQMTTGEYAKAEICQIEFTRNMNELLARVNQDRFIPVLMEGDLAATLVNTRYIVAIEEVGARGGGL